MAPKLIGPLWLLALVAVAASCSESIQPDAATVEQNAGFVPGEVLAQFSQDVPEEQALSIVDEYGLTWREWLSPHLRIALIGTPIGQEQQWVDTLNRDPRVVVAQLNHTGIEPR